MRRVAYLRECAYAVDGDAGIHCGQCASHSGNDCLRVAGRANDEGALPIVILRHRREKLGTRRQLQPFLPFATDHADDRAPVRRGIGITVERHALANRVLVGKVLLRQCLVYQHHRGGGRDVAGVEAPASKEGYLQHVVVIVRDLAMEHLDAKVFPAATGHGKVTRP
jgi:hypothetical protein